MSRLRIILWSLVAVIALLAGALWIVGDRLMAPQGGRMIGAANIGGPFTLTTHDGRKLSSADLAGRPFAVFFGFTHCPDVCPTTLFEMSENLKALGPDGDRLTVLFITVDPERDTRELLATYLESFDPRIIGLTGTQEEIDAVVKAYRATYQRVPTEGGGYTINHTASVYLMDRQGNFAGTLDYHEQQETQMRKLRRLIER
ncbi:SCO family protein [Chelatococcus composti]|jgi:protein SCO1/2|uniref:Protein SCO1/2 n=1 Tax=Chelatococcus composti TaxID=1743235 RepID=A0A841KBL6_9HYPH|nr:SCO family protein [Chelatococcus composti]MBB6168284.1 protein SCO1/2 [Chelatococcus composti]MBS7736632.1 SCO family protein [Chelatococcus composti]PZN38466.1 MAG: SCO family protein [Pseudomonadota bacterium]GGG38877.1 photosynthetic protein synthase I [Chelatococcus composti]